MRAAERRRLSAEYAYQAAEEMENAGIMRVNGKYPAACFHAQQAAEGMLKAVLIASGTDSPRVHHLEDLMVRVPEPHKTRIFQHRPKALLLEKYYLPARYVDALGGKAPASVFTLQDADDAIAAAEAIVAACGEIIGPQARRRGASIALSATANGIAAAPAPGSRRKRGRAKR
ncbi:MAG: HEPN domain-containing protein [Betaproteobacteria bacterium]|nr:HEPN domain-containing protein [Betaproteobacteria bacterium]